MTAIPESTKTCRRHEMYFPDESPVLPISEFASNGRHSYCRRCMKFISKQYHRDKAAAGGSVEPKKRQAITKGSSPLPKKKPGRKVSTYTTFADEDGEGGSPIQRAKIKAQLDESLKVSPLGVNPAIDTPFIEEGKDTVWAFKNYWFCGTNITVLGCLYSERTNWRSEIHIFRLSSVRPTTPTEAVAV